MTALTAGRVISGVDHLTGQRIQTELAAEYANKAQQKMFYENAKLVEQQNATNMIQRLEQGREIKARERYGDAMTAKAESAQSNEMIARLEQSRFVSAQQKTAEAVKAKVEAETKFVIEQSNQAATQGHLYNAGTTLACFGCVGAVICLGVGSYKIVQELRGN